MTPPQSTAGQAGVSDDFVVFQGRPGRRLGELALPHRRRRQLVPSPARSPWLRRYRPARTAQGPVRHQAAVHTREGTGKKRVLNGCTSVATATTAVHATSENVTDIQLCIAALAGFPLRIVVPIGGSARGYLADLPLRERSGHHWRPWQDSSVAWIFMQAIVSGGERTHMPPGARY